MYNLPTSFPNVQPPRIYTIDVVPLVNGNPLNNFLNSFTADATTVSGTPSYPYEECRSQTLGAIAQELGLPPSGRFDVNFAVREPSPTPGVGFLSYLHNGNPTYAAQYYDVIDPTRSKRT